MSEPDQKSVFTKPIYTNGNTHDPAVDRSRPVYGGAVDGLPVAAKRNMPPPNSGPLIIDREDQPPVAAPDPSAESLDVDEVVANTEDQEIFSVASAQSTSHASQGAHATSAGELVQRMQADSEKLYPDLSDAEVALITVLESLLFVAGEPIEPIQFAKTMDLPLGEVEHGLTLLTAQYNRTGRGLRLQVLNGKYQLVTAPVAATHVENFLSLDTNSRLSSAALETLAVIAYRQPVTRAQIEAVRGVDCAGVLRSLSHRGLVEAVGRLEAVGRPILYGVTDLFMQHFGLMELDELPPLEKEDADQLWAATALAEADDIESQ